MKPIDIDLTNEEINILKNLASKAGVSLETYIIQVVMESIEKPQYSQSVPGTDDNRTF